MLLSAPQYFNLKETDKGTVLVERAKLVKEDVSERFGNRQFYFMDQDKKLKCLSGGQLAYVIDTHNIGDGKKEVKITYDGTVKLENGKYKGEESHQFLVELLNEDAMAPEPVESNANSQDADALE